MRIVVVPGPDGRISSRGRINGMGVPDGAVLIDVPGIELPEYTEAIINAKGEIKMVANYIGTGPWYDQEADTENRAVPILITELDVVPKRTWATKPRPETPAETAAREQDELERLRQRERATLDNMTISRFQLLAQLRTDLPTKEEVEEWVEAQDEMTKLAWTTARDFRRGGAVMMKLVEDKIFASVELDDFFRRASKIEA